MLVEVGPGTALTSMARQTPQGRGCRVRHTAATDAAGRRRRRPRRARWTVDGRGDGGLGGGARRPPGAAGGAADVPVRPHPALAGGDTATSPDTAEPAPPSAAAGESTVVGEIVELWGRLLGSPDIGPDTDFFTVGGESLLFIRMVNQVQRRFAVRIPMEKLSARPRRASWPNW
ncbi:acyl carrier protein [Micromonospora sp. M12]